MSDNSETLVDAATKFKDRLYIAVNNPFFVNKLKLKLAAKRAKRAINAILNGGYEEKPNKNLLF
jgi:hypothetical protein